MEHFRTLTQFDFHQVLDETPGTSLVFFSSPGCGACRHLATMLHQYGHGHGDLSIFEVDTQKDTGLAREYEVFHLPAMFLFVDGRFHCPLECEPLPAALRRAIEQALRHPPMDPP